MERTINDLKNIRERIQNNYTKLVDTQEKINSSYSNKFNSIKDTIEQLIEEKNC